MLRKRRLALGALALALFVQVLAPTATSAADGAPANGPGVPDRVPAPEPDSEPIDCGHSAEPLQIETSSHLDPSCVWTGSVDIVASDVTFDCQGALISGRSGRGIEVVTPADVSMTRVTVRNCRLEGWLNNFRAYRDGFRTLAEGEEYDHELADITLEHSELRNSVGVGAYVDGYVSRVTIRDTVIEGAGSAGIYLETGSRRNVVKRSLIVNNGYRENGPNGQLTTFAGLQFRFWGTGREGLAIDGSYENVVTDNWFQGNSAGGVFLYKNCGEFPDSPRYFERRYGADRNTIARNLFVGGDHGVWVGQRMGENTLPMECTDDAYFTEPLVRVVRDFARDNTVRSNYFLAVTYGVRVEDDGTTVRKNRFWAPSAEYHAVVVGTRLRGTHLGEPVARTVIEDNQAFITGNVSPYRWVHGYDGLRVTGNTAGAEPVGVCEGEELPHLFLIWVLALAYEPPGAPVTPTPPGLEMPTLGALDPCPQLAEPTVDVGTVEVQEGTDATALVPIRLSDAFDRTVTVDWKTRPVPAVGDKAAARHDYVHSAGTVELDPGSTVAMVEIPLVDDDTAEPVESFEVVAVSARNASVGGEPGVVIIYDDD